MQSHLEEKDYSEKISLSLWKRLFAFARPYRGLMIQLGIANIFLGLGETIFPLLTRYWPNLFAVGCVFLLEKKERAPRRDAAPPHA